MLFAESFTDRRLERTMQFIDLAPQYQHLRAKINARIQAVLDHGQEIICPEVGELAQQLAAYVGGKHAIT